MTTQKHLHELLKEDQEPFHLKSFIADKKCQLKRLNSHKPIIKTSPITTTSKRNFCKHSCFLSFQASPEVTKSPFPSFLSPGRSPCRNYKGIGSGSVFLHIPTRTASLLLDAALKIQKQQSSKPKTQIKNLGIGLFSSILKKLKDRKRNRKNEIEFGEVKSSIQSDVGTFGSLNYSRRSSAEWSERNEERIYLDMEASTSCSYENSEEKDFVAEEGENYVLNYCEKSFCLSPHSPFRFSLQTTPSSGECTPIFASPSASPSRRDEQKEKFDVNLSENFGVEEDEKEQSSPVSVLDPPFENEDDEHESLDDEEDYDVECSFALVQRTKEQLLYKLSRFEKLAELDPVELEKRMQDEDENENEIEEHEDEETCTCDELSPSYRMCNIDSYVKEVLSKSGLSQYHRKRVPRDMDRLVSDMISEEEKSNQWFENGEILVGRVCRKLECWKEAKSNTIDMMAGMDMRSEMDQWKRFQEQKEETCVEFEVAILGVLVDELTYELLQVSK